MNEEELKIIKPFFDDENRLKSMPSKAKVKIPALRFLSESFEHGRDYTEKEVNVIINAKHTFGDYFIIRREMVELGILGRERDGSRYWLIQEEDKV